MNGATVQKKKTGVPMLSRRAFCREIGTTALALGFGAGLLVSCSKPGKNYQPGETLVVGQFDRITFNKISSRTVNRNGKNVTERYVELAKSDWTGRSTTFEMTEFTQTVEKVDNKKITISCIEIGEKSARIEVSGLYQ